MCLLHHHLRFQTILTRLTFLSSFYHVCCGKGTHLFIYLFNTLFQEGDAISYKLFLLAALIKTTTTICTIYTKSHSHEYSNKTRNSQYIYDNYKFVVRFDFICLTSRFLNEDIVLADLTAVGNLFQI